jgi:predicted transcriptional regulator
MAADLTDLTIRILVGLTTLPANQWHTVEAIAAAAGRSATAARTPLKRLADARLVYRREFYWTEDDGRQREQVRFLWSPVLAAARNGEQA